MNTRIVVGRELHVLAQRMCGQASQSLRKNPGDWMAAMIAPVTLSGDRLSCCDEGVVFDDEPERGIVTISPEGEMRSGEPTIVGIFVRASDRGKGYGVTLLEAAVKRCIERGFNRVRVDTLTKGGKATVDRLPADLLAHLDVRDQSNLFPLNL